MELFRSVLGSSGLSSGAGDSSGGPSSAETIERLVDRLEHATLIEDRRDACRALKAMSRKFRVEVGAQALEPLASVLLQRSSHDGATGVDDEEMAGYALDALCNICSPEEFDEEEQQNQHDRNEGHPTNVGEQFTEIFLKKSEHVQMAVDLLEDFDFRVRRPAVRLLTHLLLNKPRDVQELILACQPGVSRLMDVLSDPREVLRNDALLLLVQLTKGNANLQKIVAFENCFDRIADILATEGYADGGIVVEDCLRLALNLLRNNASNQTFFREGSYIQRMVAPFFDLSLDEEEVEVGWSAQKVSNVLHMLLVVRTLVSPANPNTGGVTSSCQTTMLSCGLLEKLCSILLAAGIPAEVLTETIVAIAEVIRGSLLSQTFFSRVEAPSTPPRPALILLLMSMVNERQPFALRCAVLYCFQCFLHKNPSGQESVMSTLLPSSNNDDDDVTAGQLLCGGLFSSDKLSNWLSAVALAHGLVDQEATKTELLRVQLSTAAGNEPVSLLVQSCNILQHTPHIQTRVGLLMLISTWINECPSAVKQLLSISSIVPFLTGQIGSNEHDEMERLGQGLCAFVLGLCIVHNDDSSAAHSRDQLYQLIEKRIGFETFMDKLGEVSKHEAYNRALKHPQIRSQESKELLFDYMFCQTFKRLEHVIINHLTKRRENLENDLESAQPDPAIVAQYKDIIREQDEKIRERDVRISDLTEANLFLQEEVKNAKQQIEDLTNAVETLKDMNSVLKSSQQIMSDGVPDQRQPQQDPSETSSSSREKSLERELKIRDDIIHELEMRLATIPNSVGEEDEQPQPQSRIETEMLNSQVLALQTALAKKEEELERLESDRTTQKSEVEDLLILLEDQSNTIETYEKKFGKIEEG